MDQHIAMERAAAHEWERLMREVEALDEWGTDEVAARLPDLEARWRKLVRAVEQMKARCRKAGEPSPAWIKRLPSLGDRLAGQRSPNGAIGRPGRSEARELRHQLAIWLRAHRTGWSPAARVLERGDTSWVRRFLAGGPLSSRRRATSLWRMVTPSNPDGHSSSLPRTK